MCTISKKLTRYSLHTRIHLVHLVPADMTFTESKKGEVALYKGKKKFSALAIEPERSTVHLEFFLWDFHDPHRMGELLPQGPPTFVLAKTSF